jgi:hypothetical protein
VKEAIIEYNKLLKELKNYDNKEMNEDMVKMQSKIEAYKRVIKNHPGCLEMINGLTR